METKFGGRIEGKWQTAQRHSLYNQQRRRGRREQQTHHFFFFFFFLLGAWWQRLHGFSRPLPPRVLHLSLWHRVSTLTLTERRGVCYQNVWHRRDGRTEIVCESYGDTDRPTASSIWSVFGGYVCVCVCVQCSHLCYFLIYFCWCCTSL